MLGRTVKSTINIWTFICSVNTFIIDDQTLSQDLKKKNEWNEEQKQKLGLEYKTKY